VLLGFGFLVSLSPLLWEPLVAEYPAETGVGLALLYLWSALPFFVLAVLGEGLKMRSPTFLVAALLVTGATVAVQVGVLLYASGSTDALAFVFLPLWLSVVVGLLAVFERAITTGVRRFRRG
jgi:hypothetical protein